MCSSITQCVLDLLQYCPGVVQSAKQRARTASQRRRSNLFLARDRACALGESLDAEHLASDWSYKMGGASAIIFGPGPGEEALEDVFFGFWGGSCGHVAKVKGAAEAVPRICMTYGPVRDAMQAGTYLTIARSTPLSPRRLQRRERGPGQDCPRARPRP